MKKNIRGLALRWALPRGNGSSPVLSTANKIDEEYGNPE
jgi:hypothetical protein